MRLISIEGPDRPNPNARLGDEVWSSTMSQQAAARLTRLPKGADLIRHQTLPTGRESLPEGAATQIDALVEHALTTGSGLVTAVDDHQTIAKILGVAYARRDGVRQRLTAAAEMLWLGGSMQTWTGTLAWLGVLAGAADIEPVRWLMPDSLSTLRGGRSINPTRHVEVLTDWQGDVPEWIAAWAYAAGLTPAETATRWHGGTLTEDGLRTLAGLRGYRLP